MAAPASSSSPTNLVYLYTMYSDISPIHDAQMTENLFEWEKQKAAMRDGHIRTWLIEKRIGAFPKTEEAATPYFPMFAEYSLHNSALNFLFVHDKGCSVLNLGTWKLYPTSDAAIRAIYDISPEIDLALHRNVFFKRD
jgi:hypothetical protein